MLLMNGYKQNLKDFTKTGEPTIHITVEEKPGKSKSAKDKHFTFGRSTPKEHLSRHKRAYNFQRERGGFCFQLNTVGTEYAGRIKTHLLWGIDFIK